MTVDEPLVLAVILGRDERMVAVRLDVAVVPGIAQGRSRDVRHDLQALGLALVEEGVGAAQRVAEKSQYTLPHRLDIRSPLGVQIIQAAGAAYGMPLFATADGVVARPSPSNTWVGLPYRLVY